MLDIVGINQYTGTADGNGGDGCRISDDGIKGPFEEEEMFPEERFHRADVVSQHMIDRREEQRNEKVRDQVCEAHLHVPFHMNINCFST